jgi:hypothetical protein
MHDEVDSERNQLEENRGDAADEVEENKGDADHDAEENYMDRPHGFAEFIFLLQ